MAGLVRDARGLLRAGGVGSRAANSIIKPVEGLVGAARVWESGSRGLAVFASADMFAVVLTGVPMATGVMIGRRFLVRPLLPALEALTEFEIRYALTSLASAAPDRRVVDLGAVLAAAVGGRVAELFVDVGSKVWGTYDPASKELTTADGMAAELDELIDLAAVKTMVHRGRVHATRLPDSRGKATPVIARLTRAPAD
jgi:hypothetical protein